eukprot:568385_1
MALFQSCSANRKIVKILLFVLGFIFVIGGMAMLAMSPGGGGTDRGKVVQSKSEYVSVGTMPEKIANLEDDNKKIVQSKSESASVGTAPEKIVNLEDDHDDTIHAKYLSDSIATETTLGSKDGRSAVENENSMEDDSNAIKTVLYKFKFIQNSSAKKTEKIGPNGTRIPPPIIIPGPHLNVKRQIIVKTPDFVKEKMLSHARSTAVPLFQQLLEISKFRDINIIPDAKPEKSTTQVSPGKTTDSGKGGSLGGVPNPARISEISTTETKGDVHGTTDGEEFESMATTDGEEYESNGTTDGEEYESNVTTEYESNGTTEYESNGTTYDEESDVKVTPEVKVDIEKRPEFDVDESGYKNFEVKMKEDVLEYFEKFDGTVSVQWKDNTPGSRRKQWNTSTLTYNPSTSSTTFVIPADQSSNLSGICVRMIAERSGSKHTIDGHFLDFNTRTDLSTGTHRYDQMSDNDSKTTSSLVSTSASTSGSHSTASGFHLVMGYAEVLPDNVEIESATQEDNNGDVYVTLSKTRLEFPEKTEFKFKVSKMGKNNRLVQKQHHKIEYVNKGNKTQKMLFKLVSVGNKKNFVVKRVHLTAKQKSGAKSTKSGPVAASADVV